MARTPLDRSHLRDFVGEPRSNTWRWSSYATAVAVCGCSLHSLDYLGKEAGEGVGDSGGSGVSATGSGLGGTRASTASGNTSAGRGNAGSVSASGGRPSSTGGNGNNSGGQHLGGSSNAGAPNLALDKPASASTVQTSNPVANGNDSSQLTRWCASSPSVPQWWAVDLQQSYALSGTQVTWEFARTYGYYVEVSTDARSWQEVANKRNNASTAQTQSDAFSAQARYVRITITSVVTNPSTWACLLDLQVFGKP